MASIKVRSEVAGKVWKIEAAPGASLGEDDTILILESMKMEIPVPTPRAGTLIQILVVEGDAVTEDQVVAIVET
ncbi:acetyl-CoA carboxylase biotin carboxyl carrier protein subunit [Zavarzinia sp. CC-PAN008]|uniref:acetyl-CoA carboxylase biotin carboxyl carrier protein subunit n=1 Tax=Zavarzinia sp. CC-PAN008 TaxID=3243332 RepID=UPI003F746B2B